MKNLRKHINVAATLLIASAAIQSCSMETPFSESEGILQMKLVINSDVTRAAMDRQELADNCVIYISNDKGIVFKEKGLGNLPEQITLRQGHYIAEAWTGDSVPASFDSKFYRCYEPIDIIGGLNEIQLNCKIANVVASVNASTIDEAQIKNLHVTVSTSNGSLEFDNSNFKTAKGYFMMPYDADGNRESVLDIKVEGENILGEPFTKTKTVQNVKPAHEYAVNISYDDTGEEPQGGGYLVVTIDETEIMVASTVEIFAAPLIEGVDFDIDKQIVGNPGQFEGERKVKIVAFDEIESFTIECKDAGNLNLPSQKVDLKKVDDLTIAQINAAGITWDKTVENVENNKDGHTRQLSYIYFSEAYLNSLPARDTEYRIDLTATDGNGKTTAKTLRIAVGEKAIVYDDPLVTEEASDPNNQMAIGARSATLRASIKDETASGFGIQYREEGTSEWTKVPMNGSRASQIITVTLRDLKPGTTYEYKAFADGFEASDSKKFTTESIYTIPNASMEEWSTYSASTMLGTRTVVLPGGTGDKNTSFWGSGNEGSATANKVVLDKSEVMKHSGTYSARLASTSAVGVIAAGNMFIGSYVKTDGTNGVLSLGREYNASHPSKVRVFANYRPGGGVSVKSDNEKYVDIVANGTDQGQIYVALTTEPIEIRTNPSNRNLFPSGPTNEDGKAHEDYSKVVAYGEVTWDKAFGADGSLEAVEIPFIYTDRAKTLKPKYLVIVASASKFGDFFCGSATSVMYLDDFELVYE
ncbi:MAG: PCMD domain-containing protein [Muribaculaceae bacterium]|nr:PCMD domain-containing protein [Muribaculaceae bacterium]